MWASSTSSSPIPPATHLSTKEGLLHRLHKLDQGVACQPTCQTLQQLPSCCMAPWYPGVPSPGILAFPLQYPVQVIDKSPVQSPLFLSCSCLITPFGGIFYSYRGFCCCFCVPPCPNYKKGHVPLLPAPTDTSFAGVECIAD